MAKRLDQEMQEMQYRGLKLMKPKMNQLKMKHIMVNAFPYFLTINVLT